MSIEFKNSTNPKVLTKIIGKTIKHISFDGSKETMKIIFDDDSFVCIGLTEINSIELSKDRE